MEIVFLLQLAVVFHVAIQFSEVVFHVAIQFSATQIKSEPVSFMQRRANYRNQTQGGRGRGTTSQKNGTGTTKQKTCFKSHSYPTINNVQPEIKSATVAQRGVILQNYASQARFTQSKRIKRMNKVFRKQTREQYVN